MSLTRRSALFAAIAAPMAASLRTAAARNDSGVLRISHPLEWGGSESIDPISEFRLYETLTRLYDRLVTPDATGRPAPYLATAWEPNGDATEWTFTLRDDVVFHDGSQFEAADAAYTLNRIIDPSVETALKAVLGIMEAAEAVDPTTLRVRLNAPHADFPLLLLDYRVLMIPEGSGDTIAETGIGTGPYRLETLDIDGTTRLVANEAYWQGAPKIGAVEIVPIPDAQAALQATLAGQVDFYAASLPEAQLFADPAKFTVQLVPGGGWEGFVMRTDTAPFDDPRVRRALRLAADRQEMIDLVLGPEGGLVACDHPVWPGDQYHVELDCAQDIEQARQLLADAGYPDGITVELFASDLSQNWLPLAEVYQRQAAEAGITVEIVTTASDGYYSDVWMVEPYTATAWGQREADQILNEAYRSGAAWNETFWNDPAFDALLDRARSANAFDERATLYADAQRILWETGGSLIPYFVSTVNVWNAAVGNVPAVEYDNIPWHEVTLDR
ncbi:MAG: ABC transporter substrate-binding protein [Chloroflexota bacterium]